MPKIHSLVRFYREGFERVSKVVDSSGGYASKLVVGKADKDDRIFNDAAGDLEEKRRLAIAKTERVLLRDTLRIIRPRCPTPVCYGVTSNNLREFEFFERQCAPIDLKIINENIYNYPRFSLGRQRRRRQEIFSLLLQEAKDFYARRAAINAPLVQQQLVYAREFLRYFLSFSEPRAVWPCLMVLANDHYPTQVAISMLMKGAGVPRLYIQHAEVTNSFPPLDFEYNLLRNENSLDVYKEIGQLNGAVFIMSRYDGPFLRHKLESVRLSPVNVIIYPSSMSSITALNEVVGKLKTNKSVGRIFIKPHPNSKIALMSIVDSKRVFVIERAPSGDHIAVVGNSSVVTELLHSGVPVYQNFSFDSIRADYYGFVASGLTKCISLEELSTEFWAPFKLDRIWLDTFSKLDPTVVETSEAERQRLLSAMDSILKHAESRRRIAHLSSEQLSAMARLSAWWRKPRR